MFPRGWKQGRGKAWAWAHPRVYTGGVCVCTQAQDPTDLPARGDGGLSSSASPGPGTTRHRDRPWINACGNKHGILAYRRDQCLCEGSSATVPSWGEAGQSGNSGGGQPESSPAPEEHARWTGARDAEGPAMNHSMRWTDSPTQRPSVAAEKCWLVLQVPRPLCQLRKKRTEGLSSSGWKQNRDTIPSDPAHYSLNLQQPTHHVWVVRLVWSQEESLSSFSKLPSEGGSCL